MRSRRNRTNCRWQTLGKLGMAACLVLLPLLLAACSSTRQLTQALEEQQGNFLTALPTETDSSPAAAQPATRPNPLQTCAAIPDDELEDLRAGQGLYLFNYSFDIDLKNTPQVNVTTNFDAQAQVNDAQVKPIINVNNSSASYRDGNVAYTAGPTATGLNSTLLVTGVDNVVIANTQFNLHLPDASVLIPNLNIMPGAALTGRMTK